MSNCVETMFSVREVPWHGLGTIIQDAPDSKEAIRIAGLDWRVIQSPVICADNGNTIPGYKANIRESDGKVLGMVTDKYKIVQNEEAFEWTDALLGEGVRYETAGSLQGGRKVWMLARLPHQYIINGEEITPYMVFTNSHDGSGAIKVTMTPVRVVCNNTLNLALSTTKRCWSCNHVGDINGKLEDARNTLLYAGKYMSELGKGIDELNRIKLNDAKVLAFINELIPEAENASLQQKRNILKLRDDMKARYFEAPDLRDLDKNAYRFVNAVSDFATHARPLRERANYRDNLFAKTIDGHPMIDKAYQMTLAAA